MATAHLRARRCVVAGALAVAGVVVGVAAAATPGALDPAFGAAGVARLPLGAGAAPGAVAVDGLGRVLVAGRVTRGGTIETLVARLTPTGALDPSFAGGGAAVAQLGSQPGAAEAASAIAALPDGDVVVAGLASDGRDFVERLLPGGALDPSFATAGVYLTPFVAGVAPVRLLVRPDGRLVVVGSLTSPAGRRTSLLLVGLTPSGAVDPSFGVAGVAGAQVGQRSSHAGASSLATGAALTPAGAVVVAAGATDTRGVVRGALARFTPAGGLDAGFGTRGVSRLLLLRPAGLALLADGRIVVAGQADDLAGVPSPALGGFTPSGAIDTSFGVHGLTVSALFGDLGRTGPHLRQGTALGPALTADGRLVVDAVGDPAGSSPPRVVARFSSAGAIDCTYGSGGSALLPVAGRQEGDAQPVIATGGDALVAGDLGAEPGIFVAALAGGTDVGGGVGSPRAATGRATRVAGGRVVLDGLVDPRCGTVTASFEYGLHGHLTRLTPLRAVSARPGPQQVVAVLPRLARGSYRYRLVIRAGSRRIAGATAGLRIP